MNKQIEKIACKNCIHYQMCVNTFRKGKQDGEYLLIEEEAYFANANGCDFYADKRIYRKQSEGEWISVDERLPDEYETVLAYGEEIGVRMAFYAVDKRVWNEGVITHWMPLPNPPKMKGGE